MNDMSEEEARAKLVQLLARAASDEDFFQKLKADTAKTLDEEGIKADIIPISDKAMVSAIYEVLSRLGGILEKRY